MTRFIIAVFVCFLATTNPASGDGQMQLGNFSVSLAVKDIATSRAFYEKLGFTQVAGNQAQNWLILQNSTSTIGLFQGPQYTRNMLTFNPGWDRTGSTLPDFDDVRDIQRHSRVEASCRRRRLMILPRARQAWC